MTGGICVYEEIYEQNRGLLTVLARQYENICALDRAVSTEDLMQAGFFALVKAAESFDETAGKTWAGWASWHIRRAFCAELGLREGRFTRAHTGAAALDGAVSPGDADSATLGELLADEREPGPDEVVLLDELRRSVRGAVERLRDERERRVVDLCKLRGHSFQEAADRLGISVSQARRLYARASAKLSRDRQLRALAGLDERTRFYAHKGVQAFNRDWTSVTEGAALWRIEQRNRSLSPLNEKPCG